MRRVYDLDMSRFDQYAFGPELTVCFLTMVGRGVCYKAPPQALVWLQSHISSLGLPRLYGGLHTAGLCAGYLQRQRAGDELMGAK